MNMKNIMLITLMLLAVLTIGTVSAAEDIASDNLTVSDDATDISIDEEDDSYDDYDIWANEDEDICIDVNDDEYDTEENYVAYIEMPTDATGSFRILKDNEEVARLDVDNNDDTHWSIEEEVLTGTIYPKDLNLNKINNGDIIYFKYFEKGKNNPVDSLTIMCKVTLNNTHMRLIVIDDEAEDVEFEYNTEDRIIMEEGWQENEIIEVTIKDGVDGNIVIYLNETLAFNKTLSEINPSSNQFTITLKDLNIKQAGTYLIKSYFYDTTGTPLYSYEDEEETPILVLYESQTETIDGVNINVQETRIIINNNDTLITIDASASLDDEITINIEGKEPITIKLNNTRKDDEENYIIGTKELNIHTVGEYYLNITYKGKNITDKKITLISNIVINLEDEEIIYYKLDDGFVFISLEEGEIKSADITGKINLTIIDNDGNIIHTDEIDIADVTNSADEFEDARVIKTTDINKELNGTFTVVVRYFDGDEANIQVKGNVTFKTLTSKDYGTSISAIIKDKNDTAITFTNIPLSKDITVEIDGKTIEISKFNINEDSEKETYTIKAKQLEYLTEGSHSISAYINTDIGRIDLANGNIIVDIEENVDPALTITAANIKEGSATNIVLTTNSTFNGTITVEVANTNYTVNVINGQGSLKINGLKAATYTATALFKTNGIFNDSTKTTTFTVASKSVAPVKKANVIKLTLKKIKVKKSAKKLVLTATLKINAKTPKKGTKITFTFKGKKYVGKTNRKGVAKVTIKKKVLKKLKVGKKVKYTAKYTTKTVKKIAKVKK